MNRARAPLLESQLPRSGEIALEVVGQPLRERAIEDGRVQLVVQLERAIVEVRGSDDAQDAVDHHRLGVHHRRLVLVDLDAEPEKPFVGGPPGELHRLGIGDVALDKHPHAHVAAPRLGQTPID
ncbi:hypothetical protein D3C83_22650 [compost metagenome]